MPAFHPQLAPGDGILIVGGKVYVDLDHAFTWSGEHLFEEKVSLGSSDTMTVHGGAVASNFAINSDARAISEMDTASDSVSSINYIARSRGTHASRDAVQNGDYLGTFAFLGFDGTDFEIGAGIAARVNGAPGSDDMPTELIFSTTPAGAFIPVARVTIGPSGVSTFAGPIVVGVDGTGHDVTLNGDTAGSYLHWDQDGGSGVGRLIVKGSAQLLVDNKFAAGSLVTVGGASGLSTITTKEKYIVPFLGSVAGLEFDADYDVTSNAASSLAAMRGILRTPAATFTTISAYLSDMQMALAHTGGTVALSRTYRASGALCGSGGTNASHQGLSVETFTGGGTVTTCTGINLSPQNKGGTNWQIFSDGGNWRIGPDNASSYWGSSQDARIYFDDVDFRFRASEVTSTARVRMDRASVDGGAGTATAKVGGTLSVNTTAVGNVGTGEDNLMSYSVPANTLSANGASLWFEASGSTANNANNKTLKIKLGATTLFDSGALTFSAGSKWAIRGRIIRTGAATQHYFHLLTSDSAAWDTARAVDNSAPAETLSGALTLQFTGEATSNDDIVQETLLVGYEPAP